MSTVTDVVLLCQYEEHAVKLLNEDITSNDLGVKGPVLTQINQHVVGPHAVQLPGIYANAYNGINSSQMLVLFMRQPWIYPETVQILFQEEESQNGFEIHRADEGCMVLYSSTLDGIHTDEDDCNVIVNYPDLDHFKVTEEWMERNKPVPGKGKLDHLKNGTLVYVPN